MKRIISVFAVAALMAMVVLAMSVPAFAAPSFNAQDDKNNPTYPGTGAGHNPQPSNASSNLPCAKNAQAAQCY